MTNFEEMISEFLFHCQFEKNLSDKTIKAYTIDLNQFYEYLSFNNYPSNISQIDKIIIKKYLQIISKYKPKTVKRKIATIKALFNFLEFEDIILVNPFRKIRIQIKEPKQLPEVMSIQEIKKIFKEVYKLKSNASEQLSYRYCEIARDIAVLELLFATGIRVSELCHLKKECVDLKIGIIKVVGKGNKERIIQICNKEVLTSLKEYYCISKRMMKTNDYYFTNRLNNNLSEQSVRFMVKKYTKKAKLSKKITPHTFRHTFATLLLEEDVDIKYIQHLLGHSSIMTTQIYTHVNHKKQKKILSMKHPRKTFNANDFF
jgi:integrase/recombinase XerD